MILQALNDYYQRKKGDADPAKRLPAFGLEQKEIPFVLEITADGTLVQLRDTREQVGKKKVAQSFRVPQGLKKTSAVAANLLWDSSEYVLGIADPKKLEQNRAKGEEAEYRARLVTMRQAFVGRIIQLSANALEDAGVQAVLKFLRNDPLAQVRTQANFSELAGSGAVLSFRLHGDIDLVCQRPAVAAAAAAINTSDEEDAPQAMCLVTGEIAPVERLHTAIKGVWGAQTSGANIVSFNARAFESYGKTERQGENAPVSKAAAFAYTTALNHLLGKNSAQRIQVADASTVFWADSENELEAALARIFGGPQKDNDPDASTRAVRAMYGAMNTGKLGIQMNENRFHVLGLAPNAARISVRFYHCLPLSNLASRIVAYFDDLNIVRGSYDPEYPQLRHLLQAICLATSSKPFGDIEKLPPNLGGAVIDAVLSSERALYPPQFLNAAITRCKAEQAKKDDAGRPVRHVSYLRAAILKACINRHFRIHEPNRKEISVSLDIHNTDKPYLLGRLFAAYERIQEVAAERDLNRTIRDSFFGAAMATPISVFPRLVRLNQHHLRDVKRGRASSAKYFDALLQEINGKLTSPPFPSSFLLKDQGVFALGYYHQRHAFFTKSDDKQSTTKEQTA